MVVKLKGSSGMRAVFAIVIVLFGYLQCQLWFGAQGLAQTLRLKHAVFLQMQSNQSQVARNNKMLANIHQLKTNNALIESMAREQLGMIKQGETYYRFVS
ncbi:MAG: cell division protein FtsB [Legionellaceae bacterium]|nr:cell division protein FtsB [Legionellaceae bacterium]